MRGIMKYKFCLFFLTLQTWSFCLAFVSLPILKEWNRWSRSNFLKIFIMCFICMYLNLYLKIQPLQIRKAVVWFLTVNFYISPSKNSVVARELSLIISTLLLKKKKNQYISLKPSFFFFFPNLKAVTILYICRFSEAFVMNKQLLFFWPIIKLFKVCFIS